MQHFLTLLHLLQIFNCILSLCSNDLGQIGCLKKDRRLKFIPFFVCFSQLQLSRGRSSASLLSLLPFSINGSCCWWSSVLSRRSCTVCLIILIERFHCIPTNIVCILFSTAISTSSFNFIQLFFIPVTVSNLLPSGLCTSSSMPPNMVGHLTVNFIAKQEYAHTKNIAMPLINSFLKISWLTKKAV